MSTVAIAQQIPFHAKNGMNVQVKNYKTFTSLFTDKDQQIKDNNKGYENHPEIGQLYTETPCENCYELIGNRTEKSKTYIKKGAADVNGGKDIYQQTSTHSMHYRDADGNWRTIKTQLSKGNKQGVYTALEQPVPITVNAADKHTTIGKSGESFSFNNNLELIYVQPNGNQLSLGKADWSNHTAGDDGVWVTNAWPGIDIEMYVVRGAVKTNFYINHALPQYADGQLLVRDHLQMDNGLSLFSEGKSKFSGNLSVRNKTGNDVFEMSSATVCEKNNIKSTLQALDYYIDGNQLDIALPGNYLNRPTSSYPVIIDPLVSTATVSTVTGSTYSSGFTVPCVYSNPATVPANCTITDIQWSFNYITSGGAWLDEGAVDFRLGTCRSPTGTTGVGGFYWFCNLTGAGTCTGSNISIFSDITSCVPAPQCPSYNLNITMDFYQRYLTTAPCATTYVSAATPLTITVFGHTVEINPVVVSGASTICAGQSTTLSTSATYGVPPYTYSWTPGPIAGTPVTVSPTTTTTYTATVTDACGITSSATSTITVNPVNPITGTTSVCVGGTTTLSNATAGGTWTSSNTAVATIVSSTGVVSGVSAGTTNITYTSPAGCTSTTTVTVNLLSAITGTPSACINNTSALSNTLAGGTWSSSNNSIATVSTTGVVTGVSAGTVTITYATGSGCSTTITFTVNPLPASITGPSSVCVGSTINLTSSSLTPGSWVSSAPSVATISTSGVAGGVASGNTTITYTITATGCYRTTNIAVNPTYSISFNVTICAGASYTFAGTNYTTTGVYPHVFTTINGCDSIVTLHLTVTPVTHTTVNDSICLGSTYFFGGSPYTTAGTYNATFTNITGCDSLVTLNLFVKSLPLAPITTNFDLCQNTASVAPLTAIGSNLLWYVAPTGGFASAGAPVPNTLAAGVYTWYVSQTVNGCEGPRASLQVTVHNRPIFNIVPGKPYECQFDTISLNYSGPTYPGQTFLWTIPSFATITSGTPTDPTIIVRFDTSLGTNQATLTISDGYTACDETQTFSVPVYLTAPPAFFNHNPNVCTGDSVLIALTYIGVGINDYIWNFDGGNVVVASSNHGGPYKVVWNTPGLYVVSLSAATNANCPASTVKDTIHVQPYPDASIAPFTIIGGKSVPCAGDSIIFYPLNYDDKNAYKWSPDHYFTEDNKFRAYGVVDNAGYVKLSVTSPFGCKATDSVLVDAQPCCVVSFPNAFTPNGDGKNDVFRPITTGNHKVHFFRIANRWGENVFESLQEGAGAWDGTYNGVKQDMGVYYYFISYDCNGQKIIEKGEVTLIR